MKAVRAAWWIWALVPMLLVAALLIGNAYAAPVAVGTTYEGQQMKLRLLQAPCGAKVLVHLRTMVNPEFLPKFKAAALTWNGKVYASCWVDVGGQVYSIDETGDILPPIPRAYFVDDSV